MTTPLFETLPELVADIEGALVRLGRGSIAEQLREASVHSWSFDDFSQATYLHLREPPAPGPVAQTIPLDDDISVNLDLDAQGQVSGIEVIGYEDILARLLTPVP